MIIHMTTVHHRYDSRIRYKEVETLVRETCMEVCLFVQDGLGDETDPRLGYRIVDTGVRLTRVRRMTLGAWRMIYAVLRARPSIVFFHDPELLLWSLLLKLSGIKVVYDAHEDVPRQILRNPALPMWSRPILSLTAALVEQICAIFLSAIVGATPVITRRFPAGKTYLVRNYPLLKELHVEGAVPMKERALEFAYVGILSEDRNVYCMIEAIARLENADALLRLVGKFSRIEVSEKSAALSGWSRVVFDGWLDRAGVAETLSNVRAGLVVLKPIPHEMVSLPIKMFEYMAAGLPIIASNFPLWEEIIKGAGCGILIDPEDTESISQAMLWILDHPEEAQLMGDRGRRAVLQKYNWDREADQLLLLCRSLGASDNEESPA
jgi:glycosyltransferase involved in cell wall biosynthesis